MKIGLHLAAGRLAPIGHPTGRQERTDALAQG